MLFFFTQITIQQVTPYVVPTTPGTLPQGTEPQTIPRNKSFTITFCYKFTIKNNWTDLADTMTISFPRNIYVIFSDGTVQYISNTQPQPGKSINNPQQASGWNKSPLFMRGDQITVKAGYTWPNGLLQTGTYGYRKFDNVNFPVIFKGYISEVESKVPLTLKCEDEFWLLKQTKAPDKTYAAAIDNMGSIFTDWLNSTPKGYTQSFSELGYSVERAPEGNAFFQLNIGNFVTKNDTWGTVFDRLKKNHRLFFYFRGKVLRGGGIVYYPGDQNQVGTDANGNALYNSFVFQTNIIKDDLKFQLKSDVNAGAICYSMNKEASERTNAKGNTKTSTSRLQVTVGAPKESSTEYFTFFFRASSTQELTDLGNKQLSKYYYDGFRGKLTTIGLPYVTHGNIVTIQDAYLPERNGNYLVKSVTREFSVGGGFRQLIELHLRTDNLSPDDYSTGI